MEHMQAAAGTQRLTAALLLLCTQLCFACRSLAASLLVTRRRRSDFSQSSSSSPLSPVASVLLYSACILCPCTLSMTLLAAHLPSVCLAQLLFCIACIAVLSAGEEARLPVAEAAAAPEARVASLAVTLYRVSLLLSTAVAILAVDFPAFPRRLAKTEEFGLSPVRDRARQQTAARHRIRS
jgi:hypothetical protein